jgi:hypothetical protein
VAVFALGVVRAEVRRGLGIVLDQSVHVVGLVLVEAHESLVTGRKPTLLPHGVVVSPRVLLRFFLQVSVRPYPHQAGSAEGTDASCIGPLVFKNPDTDIVFGVFGHLALLGCRCCSRWTT